MNIPDNLRYTKDHEWVRIDGDSIHVGITDYAQNELGDIVFVEFLEEGSIVSQGDSFGTVESVKAVSDLYVPAGGTITEINSDLMDAPELVNQDCYGDAWMIIIELDDPAELDELMDAGAYAEYLAQEAS